MVYNSLPISDIASINERQYSSKEQWPTIQYLDTGNATKGKIGTLQLFHSAIDKIPSRARRKVKDSSIIYSMVRPNQQHYALLENPPENMLVSTGFSVIDVDESKVLPRYLYYALTRNEVTNYFQALSEQSVSTYPTLEVNDLASFEICLPSIDIQEQISSILGILDEKIALNNRINDYLEELGQIAIQQYLESCSSEIELGALMEFGNGFAFKSKTYTDTGKYKVLTIKNVQDGSIDCSGANRIDEIPLKMKDFCRLRPGDVVLSLTGNVGRIAIVSETDCLLNQRVAVLIPNNIEILPGLYFFFRRPAFKNEMIGIARGTAQANLSPVETLRLLIPYDVDRFNALSISLRPVFDLILFNKMESLRLIGLRDTLLPKLMSGEIDVSKINTTQLNNHLYDC